MTLHHWLSLATCVAQLGLAVLSAARAAHGPLAMPLARLCFVMFAWSFAEWAFDVSGARVWGNLDVTLSPLTAPAAVQLVVAFLGARRRLRWFVVVSYLTFGALSLACATAFVSEAGERFAPSALRGQILGALIVPTVAYALVLLVRHDREQTSVQEKLRTRLVLAALAAGGALGAADVLNLMNLRIPSMLVTTGLLAVVALRFQLFDREPSRMAAAYALAAATVGLVALLAAFRAFHASEAALILSATLIAAAVGVALRQASAAAAAGRAEAERLLVLGRLSAQMAHDLKNPLAALKGAAQFLQEERAQGRSIDAQAEFLDMFVSEADRLSRLVERYQRLGRLDISLRVVDVNRLVRSVASLRQVGLPEGKRIELQLGAELPPCLGDPDLLAAAVENLLRNALEALRDGGWVVVRTGPSEADPRMLVISVADDGVGMNAREQERAFDEFFTTKASGSGLGLPFVKRVAEAHDGHVVLRSKEGAGTEVELHLPVSPAAAGG